MEYPDFLPALMKDARIAANMTQAEVAKKLNITAQAISNFERGKGSLSRSNMKALCDLYGIDSSSLDTKLTPEAIDISAQASGLISSAYALEPKLLPPIVSFLNYVLDATDDIIHAYSLEKKRRHLDKSMMEHCRELEVELKFLPMETDEDRKRAVAYEQKIRSYKQFDPLKDDAFFRYEIDDAYKRINHAASNFSEQLNTILKKTLQEVSDPSPENPSPDDKE